MDIKVGANTVKLTRKTHRKVRTGCSVCKVRKIKCDEKKPQCGRCESYGATCDILDAQHAWQNHKLMGTAWRPLAGPQTLNMLDLELMFHWGSSTCLTLSPDPVVQDFFRRITVTIALRCDFVALALLSLAAFHLAHECPERRVELTERGLQYHNAAAGKAIALLPIPDEPGNVESVENLFVFSSLTMYHVISSSEQTYELLLGRTPANESADWLSLFAGTAHLALSTSSVDNRFSILFPLMNHIISSMEARRDMECEVCMPLLRDHLAAALDPSRIGAYMTAIGDLDKTWAVARENHKSRDLMSAFSWLHPTIEDLLPELRDPSPPQEALVIFCYFCMMMDEMPKEWWLGAWVQKLMQSTYGLLDDEHKSWVVRPPDTSSVASG